MSEKNLVNRFRNKCRGVALFQRIESPLTGVGVPDVILSYQGVRAFIEFKYVASWPKRSKLKLRHFTSQQRQFLHIHGTEAGHCYLFLQVEQDLFLFSYDELPSIEGNSKEEMVKKSKWYSKKLNIEGVLNVVIQNQTF